MVTINNILIDLKALSDEELINLSIQVEKEINCRISKKKTEKDN